MATNEDTTFGVGCWFKSNGGNGPLQAQVTAMTKRTVTLGRLRKHTWMQWQLPREFFVSSPSCGWRHDPHCAEHVTK